jgi:hypothetical protein
MTPLPMQGWQSAPFCAPPQGGGVKATVGLSPNAASIRQSMFGLGGCRGHGVDRTERQPKRSIALISESYTPALRAIASSRRIPACRGVRRSKLLRARPQERQSLARGVGRSRNLVDPRRSSPGGVPKREKY